MSARSKKNSVTPYIIGASDLAFILLFFFIVVGQGSEKLERIEMPHKQSTTTRPDTQAPFRIEIYDQSKQSDSSRMAVIFTRAKPNETLFVAIDNADLARTSAYSNIFDNVSNFIGSKDVESDSVRVDVFSSAYSYYGLIALAVAACNQLQYPCNLVYRADAG
jgi:hypothetical protein